MTYDPGPSVRRARGVVIVDAHPDPARPLLDGQGIQVGYHLVTGARVRSGAEYLFKRRTITAAQFDTAERYVATVERMHGARDGRTEGTGRVPPHQQGHPSEDQVNAATDLRRAVDGVGKGGMGLIGAIVLDGNTLDGMAILLSEDVRHVVGRLRAALDRLGEVWS